MCRVRYFIWILLLSSGAWSQTYSLQQCIDSALAHNVRVRQAGLQVRESEVAWRQSRSNALPVVSADISHSIYQGRSIDPFSNSYVNQSLGSANYGLNSAIVLFNGGSIQNGIRQQGAAYDASRMEWQQQKDNLVLNVVLAYLNILSMEDQVVAAQQRAEVSTRQLERLSILNSQGAIRPSDHADMQGQLMNDQLAITNARNDLEVAKLNLAQLMNKPYSPSIKVERIPAGEVGTVYPATAAAVFESAQEQFPMMKAVVLRRKSFEHGVKAARGGLYPIVSIGGGLNTNYSSIAQNALGKVPYNSQLRNNVSSSIGVGVSIPIFNRLQARNRVKLADIALRNSEMEEEAARIQLRQQVDAAYLNMTNALERYNLLQKQVAAYTESFKAAEVRYNAGVGTSIDYLAAKDRLDRSTLSLITARYDYLLRRKILDYYQTSRLQP